jgi:hypothetical protein
MEDKRFLVQFAFTTCTARYNTAGDHTPSSAFRVASSPYGGAAPTDVPLLELPIMSQQLSTVVCCFTSSRVIIFFTSSLILLLVEDWLRRSSSVGMSCCWGCDRRLPPSALGSKRNLVIDVCFVKTCAHRQSATLCVTANDFWCRTPRSRLVEQIQSVLFVVDKM